MVCLQPVKWSPKRGGPQVPHLPAPTVDGAAEGLPRHLFGHTMTERGIAGPAAELGWSTCTVASMHYISGEAPADPFEAQAKIRYRHRATPVVAAPLSGGRLHVRFSRQQRDVTPGQYLVLYDGDVVIGGGPIERGLAIVKSRR